MEKRVYKINYKVFYFQAKIIANNMLKQENDMKTHKNSMFIHIIIE